MGLSPPYFMKHSASAPRPASVPPLPHVLPTPSTPVLHSTPLTPHGHGGPGLPVLQPPAVAVTAWPDPYKRKPTTHTLEREAYHLPHKRQPLLVRQMPPQSVFPLSHTIRREQYGMAQGQVQQMQPTQPQGERGRVTLVVGPPAAAPKTAPPQWVEVPARKSRFNVIKREEYQSGKPNTYDTWESDLFDPKMRHLQPSQVIRFERSVREEDDAEGDLGAATVAAAKAAWGVGKDDQQNKNKHTTVVRQQTGADQQHRGTALGRNTRVSRLSTVTGGQSNVPDNGRTETADLFFSKVPNKPFETAEKGHHPKDAAKIYRLHARAAANRPPTPNFPAAKRPTVPPSAVQLRGPPPRTAPSRSGRHTPLTRKAAPAQGRDRSPPARVVDRSSSPTAMQGHRGHAQNHKTESKSGGHGSKATDSSGNNGVFSFGPRGVATPPKAKRPSAKVSRPASRGRSPVRTPPVLRELSRRPTPTGSATPVQRQGTRLSQEAAPKPPFRSGIAPAKATVPPQRIRSRSPSPGAWPLLSGPARAKQRVEERRRREERQRVQSQQRGATEEDRGVIDAKCCNVKGVIAKMKADRERARSRGRPSSGSGGHGSGGGGRSGASALRAAGNNICARQKPGGPAYIFQTDSGEYMLAFDPEAYEPSQIIKWEDLELKYLIAEGAFGSVFRGVHRGEFGERDVAVKVFFSDKTGPISKEHFLNLERELNAYRVVSHRSILRLVGVCIEPPHLAIVTEYLHGGNLFDILFNHLRVVTAEERLIYAKQLCEVVIYLHSMTPPIVHRDLKTQNMLLDNRGKMKLCDFGMAKKMENGQFLVLDDNGGSPRYMAPESYMKGGTIDEKADIWGLGCCLIELFGGPIPYEELDKMPDVIRRIFHERKNPTIPETFEIQTKRIIEQCFDRDPRERPAAVEVLEVLQTLTPTIVRRHEMDMLYPREFDEHGHVAGVVDKD
ncbi:unnamed protein product [Vitrella brassicaformis CCMP3155]|uniref:Protein kinase domain-containing protein n=2 Tax=Vitrella brassicaformis TaxID=1169539 RepID=A0A0G4G4C7_VITBC|nr:unnamed protein product [Vitrella brassicaformis CCMP3155]|eukprot:CEM23193.1 unnamed protein product [Vitrella brassicaformis CCMP3155]